LGLPGPLGLGDHDLGDIGRAGIVDRPGTGERGKGRYRTFAAPAVATHAGALEHHLAARIGRTARLLRARYEDRPPQRRYLPVLTALKLWSTASPIGPDAEP
jgi:hypothetical protein